VLQRSPKKPRKGTKKVAKAASVMDRLRELDDERAKLVSDAKADALKKVEDAVAELNALGFAYSVSEGGTRRASSGDGTRKGTRGLKDAACPICGFKTSPLHDKRAHRSQAEKKPFTAEELAAKGYTRV